MMNRAIACLEIPVGTLLETRKQEKKKKIIYKDEMIYIFYHLLMYIYIYIYI